MPNFNFTIREAEDAIRRRFTADRFQGELRYDPAKVIETDQWWYIPYTWIGCKGFIVSKEDLYVNWLGSGLTLEECLWGHEHGVVYDLVDFSFAPNTDTGLAKQLVSRFKHMHPNASGMTPSEPVWYRDSEVEAAVSNQFPNFKRHFVWSTIPELMEAYDNERLRFTCHPSARSALLGLG